MHVWTKLKVKTPGRPRYRVPPQFYEFYLRKLYPVFMMKIKIKSSWAVAGERKGNHFEMLEHSVLNKFAKASLLTHLVKEGISVFHIEEENHKAAIHKNK